MKKEKTAEEIFVEGLSKLIKDYESKSLGERIKKGIKNKRLKQTKNEY